MTARLVAALSLLTVLSPLPATAAIDARMLRYPDVSSTQVSFVYAGDIWLAPKSGGRAHRLSTPSGEESFPRFSPDGQHLAFTTGRSGENQVWILRLRGGEAEQVTHAKTGVSTYRWSPDGTLIADAVCDGSKARRELGHRSRPLWESVRDALVWWAERGVIEWTPQLRANADDIARRRATLGDGGGHGGRVAEDRRPRKARQERTPADRRATQRRRGHYLR